MFLGLQETRMTQVDLFKIKSVWGNQHFYFVCSSARGRFGGIISIWDPSYFIKNKTFCTESLLLCMVNGCRWTCHD